MLRVLGHCAHTGAPISHKISFYARSHHDLKRLEPDQRLVRLVHHTSTAKMLPYQLARLSKSVEEHKRYYEKIQAEAAAAAQADRDASANPRKVRRHADRAVRVVSLGMPPR